ncbi:MAG: bifunctional glutamate N-acetyltransferase/amino-acid acetyltransferase ArgJ [Candidatus Sumerlaeaceae bacterium]|nr:bifunctional glutamate N-acetyltransferase/amino-acid acetyltransferase ArgJ [Candidatus Sumerlaeaceae bacterium]
MKNWKADLDFEVPAGFRWAAASGSIKKPGRLDVGLFTADTTATAAATFTQNDFRAAPVLVSQQTLQETGSRISGVVVNSGCANAATGAEGSANASSMAATAQNASGREAPLLVCSTGTIGVQLPMDRVTPAIADAAAKLSGSREAFNEFAQSILTTDTCEKIAWASFVADGKTVRILGCAKGSGMMYPRMATLLAFVATDADIAPDLLRKSFSNAVELSLNCMTIDGDTSTNDTAIILASGKSGANVTAGSDTLRLFDQKLLEVMQSLARQLARDGEGATKLIEINVQGAADFTAARHIGREIANSNLVKTAIYGRDANWGRICCAIGNAGAGVDTAKVQIKLGDIVLFKENAPLPLDEEAALKVLSEEFIPIEARVGSGPGSATVWTCDLTDKYIEINGSYRT